MKLLVILLVALALGVGAGLLLQGQPGYLLIAHGNWQLETSVLVALGVIAVLFLLLHSLFKLISWAIGAGPRWRGWRGRKRRAIAHRELIRGINQLLEGRWERAEKRLTKHLRDSELPLLNHLASAWAAQEQGEYHRRDRHLKQARQLGAKDQIAVSLLQAEAQCRSGEVSQALETAEALHKKHPKHPWGLRLLARIRYQVEDWHGLLQLIPALRRHTKLATAEAAEITQHCHQALLTQSVELADGHWQSLPKPQRSEPELVLCFAQTLTTAKQLLRAERLLLNALEQQWDSRLLATLNTLPSEQPTARLKKLEGWLPNHPDDPQLLLTTAITCRSLELWGKARSLLEQSLALNPAPETRYQLAALLLQLGENDAALGQFQLLAAAPSEAAQSADLSPLVTMQNGQTTPSTTGLLDNALLQTRFPSG